MKYLITSILAFASIMIFGQGTIPLTNIRYAPGSNYIIRSEQNGKPAWVKDTVYYTYSDGILSIQDNSGLYSVDLRDTLFGTVDTTGLVALIQNVAPLTDSLSWAQITNKPVTFTPTAHLHSIVEVNGLLGALEGKSDTAHVHPISDVISLQDSLNARSKLGHTHVINDVAFLQDNLNLKSNVNHNHDERYYTEPQTDSLLLAKSDTSHTHTKDEVGLANVDNTSDLLKPVSIFQQAALDLKANIGHNHVVANVQGLQDSLNARPNETTATIQAKRPLKTIETQSLEGNGNIDLVKADVGLANVDNTSDINKPISTATQTALNTKLENVTGTLPISTSGTGVTRNISIATANGSTTGALTGTDWTTFNNKVGGTGAVGQAGFFTGTNTLGGDNNFFWDNTSKRFGLGTSTPTASLDVRGLAKFLNATATADSSIFSAVDISNFNITARSGLTDWLYGLRISGTMSLNTLNQAAHGLLINLNTNATTSHFVYPLIINTSANTLASSTSQNANMESSSGNEFRVVRGNGINTGQVISTSARSFDAFRSMGIYFQDFQNTNYWGVGTVNSDYLRFFHNDATSATGIVDPTMYIKNKRVGIGQWPAFVPSGTLHIRGEGATDGTFSLQVHNSTNASNSLIVRDDGNVGIGTNAPTEKLHVTGNIRVTSIPTYATTAAAAADGALTAGSFFKVSNGNGTSALHIKD